MIFSHPASIVDLFLRACLCLTVRSRFCAVCNREKTIQDKQRRVSPPHPPRYTHCFILNRRTVDRKPSYLSFSHHGRSLEIVTRESKSLLMSSSRSVEVALPVSRRSPTPSPIGRRMSKTKYKKIIERAPRLANTCSPDPRGRRGCGPRAARSPTGTFTRGS